MPDRPAAKVSRLRLRVKPVIVHQHLFIPFPVPMIRRGGVMLRKRKF